MRILCQDYAFCVFLCRFENVFSFLRKLFVAFIQFICDSLFNCECYGRCYHETDENNRPVLRIVEKQWPKSLFYVRTVKVNRMQYKLYTNHWTTFTCSFYIKNIKIIYSYVIVFKRLVLVRLKIKLNYIWCVRFSVWFKDFAKNIH